MPRSTPTTPLRRIACESWIPQRATRGNASTRSSTMRSPTTRLCPRSTRRCTSPATQNRSPFAVHPEFSRDPDERAVVIVREGHGVVGLKDAWTPEQLKQGKISHRIGHFTAAEMRLLEAEPTRSVLPRETG